MCTYICIYIYICIQVHKHHSDNRSMPIGQQGLGRPKVGDKIVDQQGAGCQGNLAPSEDGELKARLQTHKQIFQNAY